MEEVKNILKIFEEAKKAIKENNTAKLKSLSNQTNNTASRTHDPDNIAVAVIIYSLGKILERENYRNYFNWEKFYKNLLIYFDKEINALKNNNEKEISKTLKLIRGTISNLSRKLKIYISDVFRKAQINKALKIYEHGISLEKTANLLGITMFELANYSGQKKSFSFLEEKAQSVRKRIKIAENMFK
jgi:hypothetical protein